ncbi:hypothetical protein E8E14_003533 [Neopestalotiopsis sp. 37M]|nr:hypothetical protein E8E14_003533 [Neopestalotiopsis sp. 37M]
MLQSMPLEEFLFSRTAPSVKYLPLEDAVGTQAFYLLYDKVFLGEHVSFYKEL